MTPKLSFHLNLFFSATLCVALLSLGALLPLNAHSAEQAWQKAASGYPKLNQVLLPKPHPHKGVDRKFGSGVALDGNTLLVSGVDSVYEYTWDGSSWVKTGELKPSGEQSDQIGGFGQKIRLSSDLAVIAANGPWRTYWLPIETELWLYVFRRTEDGWKQQTIIKAPKGQERSRYAKDFDVSDDFIAILSPSALSIDDAVNSDFYGAVYVFTEHDDVWKKTQRVTVPKGKYGNGLSSSVAIDGNQMVIGSSAHSESDTKLHTGTAYVFELVNGIWQKQAMLLAEDLKAWEGFGREVAISGDRVVISAPNPAEYERKIDGQVYVFEKQDGTWQMHSRIDDEEVSWFGDDVSLSGDRLTVTSPSTGKVHLYEFDAVSNVWKINRIISANHASQRYPHPMAIAMDGNRLVLAEPNKRLSAGEFEQQGRVRVFEHQADGFVAMTPASFMNEEANGLTVAGDHFGWQHVRSGDTMLVTASHDQSSKDAYMGAVYVYRKQGMYWWFQQKMLPPTSVPLNDFGFGSIVDMDEGTFAIGMPDAVGGRGKDIPGKVLVYQRNESGEWAHTATLMRDKYIQNDGFGKEVLVRGNKILVGAPENTAGNFKMPGSIFVFEQQASGEWRQIQRITPEVFPANLYGGSIKHRYFGQHISQSGNQLLSYVHVGEGAEAVAAALVYQQNAQGNWVKHSLLKAPESNEQKKHSLLNSGRVSDNHAIINGYYVDQQAVQGGTQCYAFHRNTKNEWQYVGILSASSTNGPQGFAPSCENIVLNDNQLFLNAVNDQTKALHEYRFDHQQKKWVFDKQHVTSEQVITPMLRHDHLEGFLIKNSYAHVGGAVYVYNFTSWFFFRWF